MQEQGSTFYDFYKGAMIKIVIYVLYQIMDNQQNLKKYDFDDFDVKIFNPAKYNDSVYLKLSNQIEPWDYSLKDFEKFSAKKIERCSMNQTMDIKKKQNFRINVKMQKEFKKPIYQRSLNLSKQNLINIKKYQSKNNTRCRVRLHLKDLQWTGNNEKGFDQNIHRIKTEEIQLMTKKHKKIQNSKKLKIHIYQVKAQEKFEFPKANKITEKQYFSNHQKAFTQDMNANLRYFIQRSREAAKNMKDNKIENEIFILGTNKFKKINNDYK